MVLKWSPVAFPCLLCRSCKNIQPRSWAHIRLESPWMLGRNRTHLCRHQRRHRGYGLYGTVLDHPAKSCSPTSRSLPPLNTFNFNKLTVNIIKFWCYMFCFDLLLTDVPLKLPFARMENLFENTVNETDSTADFIVFPPFNLGFLMTSVFFSVYLSVNLYVELRRVNDDTN